MAATRTVIPVALGLLPVAMGLARGSYFASTWTAVGVALGAMLVVVRLTAGSDFPGFRRDLPRAAWIATILLGTLTAFTLLSSAWALDKGAALEGGTRTALYFVLFLVAIGTIETGREARLFATAYVLATALVAAGVIGLLYSSADPQDFFGEIKLAWPVGYSNAEGTFFLMPALLAVHLASRLSTRAPLRPLLFAAGVLLLQAGVLTQSRGAFWAAIGAFVAYLVMVPNRPRALLWWGLAALLLVATFPYLNALQGDLHDRDYGALVVSVHQMARAVVAGLLVAVAAASALTWIDARISLPRSTRWIGQALAVAAVVVLLVALVYRFPQLEQPVEAARSAWSTFKGEGSSGPPESDIRLLDLRGTYRYELWQVAWTAFTAQPVHGVGADNYVIEWDRLRPLVKDVRQPHNLYLRLLAETGFVGFLVFAAAVISAYAGALARTVGRRGHDRSLVAGLGAASLLFLIHAMVEWVWHVPATAAAFFIMLGVIAGLQPRPARGREATPVVEATPTLEVTGDSGIDELLPAASPTGPLPSFAETTPNKRWRPPRPLSVAAAAGAVLLALSVPQALALRLSDHASSLLASRQYSEAVSAATWAARINPLQEEPLVVKGRALARQGDDTGADVAFSGAVDRQPASWLAYLRWGETREQMGLDPTAAYEAAARLNPLSPAVHDHLATLPEAAQTYSD